MDKRSTRGTTETLQVWASEIKSRINDPETLCAWLSEQALDQAWVPVGGTGAKAEVFRLEQEVDARLEFDGSGELFAWAVYKHEHAWRKQPDGTLQGPAANPGMPLNLIES